MSYILHITWRAIVSLHRIAMLKGLYFTTVVTLFFFLLTSYGLAFFWDRLLTMTKHIFATEHDINIWEESFQSTGTPYMLPKYGELCSRNG